MAILTNRQDVINNFSKYLGRKPNEAEIAKYMAQSLDTLIKDLTATRKQIMENKPAPDSIDVGTNEQTYEAELEKYLQGEISSGNIDSYGADLIRTAVHGQDWSNKQPTVEELASTIKNINAEAEKQIGPYYQMTSSQEMTDLKNKMADVRGSMDRYIAKETSDYNRTLTDTKAKLRAAGLTFGSGKALAKLGGEQAFGYTPEPLKARVEGELPGVRREQYAADMATFGSKVANLGIDAERRFGRGAVQGMNFGTVTTPYISRLAPGGAVPVYNQTGTTATAAGQTYGLSPVSPTGTLESDRLKALEERKAKLMDARLGYLY